MSRYERRDVPPLRADPATPDARDGARLDYYHGLWRSQDAALRPRDRQIEENARMLAGQHWNVWNPVTGKFYDISEWMTDAERRWRQRPVINRVQMWFILTHARLTENPPILTFLPGPDEIDAELAEVQDQLFKLMWRDANMVEVVDRMMAWMIPAGRVHLVSRVDLTKGPWSPWVGQHNGALPIVDPATGQAVGMMPGPFEQVPFDQQGQPLAVVQQTPDGPMVVPTGKPHATRQGVITCDVRSPLEVRAEWGPQPWQDKRWHGTVGFFTPEQVYEMWGVDVEPDANVNTESGMALLDRVLFGTGFYGAASGRFTAAMGGVAEAREGMCTVHEIWEKPSRISPETPDNPGGRHIVFTPKRLILDREREVAYPYTSPIRCFDFIRIPGRPSGTSAQDSLNGPNRSYNKLRAQIMEHANLCANPKHIIDGQSGIEDGQWTNEPGTGLRATRRPGVPAIEWLQPPQLGKEVFDAAQMARDEIDELGFMRGTQGEPLSPDQSGEAIKELRFNSDRFLGPVARRAVEEFARLGEDWIALAPVIYDQPRVLKAAGDDNVATTITVYPELFKEGKVNVVPDVESMLPEGRGERQAQAYQLWKDGAFNTPADPFGTRQFMEVARFPALSRAGKVGGVDRVTADQENGDLVLGIPWPQIPVLPWYDHLIHLQQHERVMKSREFLKYAPEVQDSFIQHRNQHMMALGAAMGVPQGQPAPSESTKRIGPGGSSPMGSVPPIQPGIPTPPASVPASAMPTATAPPPTGLPAVAR